MAVVVLVISVPIGGAVCLTVSITAVSTAGSRVTEQVSMTLSPWRRVLEPSCARVGCCKETEKGGAQHTITPRTTPTTTWPGNYVCDRAWEKHFVIISDLKTLVPH